jgi:hypothetical protein
MMINDRYRDKMKKLEQEREAMMKKLTPEAQKEYQQKKDAFTPKPGAGQDSSAVANQP